jgi:hypothetical protein
MSAWFILQQACASLGIPISQDGSPGPQTEHCAAVLASTVKHRKSLPKSSVSGERLPLGGGRCSWFGGSKDPGDYREGQGNMPQVDPDGSGPRKAWQTPAQYYAREDVKQFHPYLIPEMATTESWVVNGIEMGVSYFLKGNYAAARLYDELKERAQAGEEILIEVTNTAEKDENGEFLRIVLRVLDWGPTELYTKAIVNQIKKTNPNTKIKPGDKWPFDLDISKEAYDYLKLKPKWDKRRGRWLDAVDWRVL